ncbi:hypothetical protein C3747_40g174 [Trypanosoma cruzi]|uniref:Uncharacterized protein n=2 Tax=Trypanosoma cruzi TaxID=5693 RepID=Q4DP69_TRYCC|nr:hypothetical protein, conserved [Trypanosoma cruzi]EAN94313.1 hypothetical protein, conserved [Trypanosoma cruzi]KAF5224940.1 hypothetical protein ECC02_001873 [Trypanosoma cruzi]PWV13963.1 hypothetical protein C3747_40g174 [Trypanosoma cruzi]RNC60091.1 hypothetical protein TcCL_ESM02180 [Trypanosoma cruzi]|eukprot:XP_816164.1 hypothetical protein [Trypanosoma cruzi strain CL Brener]
MLHRRRTSVGIRRGTTADEVKIAALRGAILPEMNNGLQRVGHTIVVYKQDLYLYGGYGPKNTYSSCIFCNVKMTLQWKEIRGVGVVPSGRANHSAVMHEKRMIIFGGHRNLEVFDDMYLVNLETMRWEKVNYERAQGPGPVFSHAAVYVPPTQTMIVIGGFHQRQHNMYIAHSFDIRHRVWTGIRGPDSVDPLHVQMCCAAYNTSSSSIIVVGLVEKDVLLSSSREIPSVFKMNVHSGVWVEVNTPVSLDSPIPFRMSGVWEYFLREMISMGGVYEDLCEEWFFPLVLAPIENFIFRKKLERISSGAATDTKTRSRTKMASYGFFKLQFCDMTWSIIPVNFPRRVVSELTARRASRSGSLANLQPLGRRSKKVPLRENKRKIPFFSVGGVSRFQRKYAFAVTDASDTREGRTGSKLIVMHGGVTTEDYVMFLFTPILKKRTTSVPTSSDSFFTISEADSCTYSHNSRCGGSTDQSSMGWDDDQSFSGSDIFRIISGEKKVEKLSSRDDIADSNIMVGRAHRIGSDPTLLPLLPSIRGYNNSQRFALLYHPLSAVHSDKLLPDPTCPVAVLSNESELKTWAENFYAGTRQWIAAKLEVTRREEKGARRKKKGRESSRTATEESDEISSSSESEKTKDSGGTQLSIMPSPLYSTTVQSSVTKPKDFFLDKNLEVFDFNNVEVRRASYNKNSPFLLPGEMPEKFSRLRMSARRKQAVQRTPSTVFQRFSLGHITDDGGTTAFLLMTSALARFNDGSYESARQRALIRWRYLRVMVLNGEAYFIMHRVNQEETRVRGVDVSTTSMLTLAPELRTKGLNPNKVFTRPIPYTVPAKSSVALRSSEVTPSGLVAYHCINNIK